MELKKFKEENIKTIAQLETEGFKCVGRTIDGKDRYVKSKQETKHSEIEIIGVYLVDPKTKMGKPHKDPEPSGSGTYNLGPF